MNRSRTALIATILILVTLPVMFLFQNCAKQTQFKMEEPSQVVTPTSNSICTPMSEIQGDMRVEIIPGSPWLIEFGTFRDNYWEGDQSKGKVFDRRLEISIPDIAELTQFTLDNVAYDDWMLLKVNGQMVYLGPVEHGDRS